MMQAHSLCALIPTGPRIQKRARGPWYTAPLSPAKGRTYTEFDGGVEGHAPRKDRFRIQQRPWSVGELLPNPGGAAGTQARPVEAYSSHSAEIRRRDGFTVFVCKKDAQHNALRVFWLGTITPRPNRVFNALGLVVKRQSQGSSFSPPSLLQQAACDMSDMSGSAFHRCESFTDGGFLCGTIYSDSEPRRFA